MQYRRVAETEGFRKGIGAIVSGAQTHRIALMCAEREPLECHRGLLIAPELEKSRISVVHILADGSTETHRQAMDRLLALFRLPEEDLFRSRAELIEEACLRQQERIAYDGRPLPQERTEAAAG